MHSCCIKRFCAGGPSNPQITDLIGGIVGLGLRRYFSQETKLANSLLLFDERKDGNFGGNVIN